MNTAHAYHVRSAFIFAVVAAVVLGALGMIAEVLWGSEQLLSQFNWTCLIMAAAGACGLACASMAVRGSRALPVAGILLILSAAVLLTGYVWVSDVSVEYWQITCCFSIFAVASGHLAALSLARLAPRHMWSMVLAYVLVIAVACLGALRILEFPWGPGIDRPLSIMMILDVAVTILIPFFHWWSRDFAACDGFDRRYAELAEPQFPREEDGRYVRVDRLNHESITATLPSHSARS
jgi:hypothetical protein